MTIKLPDSKELEHRKAIGTVVCADDSLISLRLEVSRKNGLLAGPDLSFLSNLSSDCLNALIAYHVDFNKSAFNELVRLTGLRKLYIGDLGASRRIMSLPNYRRTRIEDFERIRELTQLEVFHCCVIDLDEQGIETIGSLNSLKNLELGGQINDSNLKYLATLPHLQSLSLPACDITGLGMARLQCRSTLEILGLRGTLIHKKHFAELNDFSKLIDLDLDGTPISHDDLCHLPNLPNLQVLSVRFTSIGNQSLEKLKTFSSLRILDIRDTKINDDGLTNLQNLTMLWELIYSENQISSKTIATLKSHLPSCAIRVDDVDFNWGIRLPKHRFGR